MRPQLPLLYSERVMPRESSTSARPIDARSLALDPGQPQIGEKCSRTGRRAGLPETRRQRMTTGMLGVGR